VRRAKLKTCDFAAARV